MTDVLAFLATVVSDTFTLVLDNLPRDYLSLMLLLFVISLVVSRLIVPVIARNKSIAEGYSMGLRRKAYKEKREKRSEK